MLYKYPHYQGADRLHSPLKKGFIMRSLKLLAVAALISTLVAGPVLAQEAMTAETGTPAAETTAKDTAKTHKKAHHKKAHKKHTKATTESTTESK